MSAYDLSEDWVKIEETYGYLHNTSQQNIEFIIVPEGTVPQKGSGKVIMPRNFHYFNLQPNTEMYVRVFRKMPSGYVPTVSVNSTADNLRRADNDLEGSTNSLTIGLSMWKQTAWYPLEWVVIANGSLWLCVEAHQPSTEFQDDVDAGYWQCLSMNGTGIVGLTALPNGKLRITYSDSDTEDITLTGVGASTATNATNATNDGLGRNIANTYMTKTEVTTALASYATTSAMETAIENTASSIVESAVGEAVNSLSGDIDEATSSLATLGNSAIVSASKVNDYTIRLTHGNGTNTDLTLGSNTYITASDLATFFANYAAANETVTNVTADATSIKKSIGGGTPTTVLTIDTALSTSSTNPVQNKAVATAINTLTTAVGGAVTNITADATSIKKSVGGGTAEVVATIDTALDSASTNLVQNKPVALAIASLASRVSALESAISSSSSSSSSSGGSGHPEGCGG